MGVYTIHMYHRPKPITEMLARQLQEVKLLIREVQEKIETIDVDEVLEKTKKKSNT
jgi:hypothetical protein